MKAIIYKEYGSPEVLQLKEIPTPNVQKNQILVKQHASTVNSADVRLRKADPFLVRLVYGLFKPKINVLGMVIAGEVEDVGTEVTQYKIGDKVFGLNDSTLGAYAQYTVVSETTPLALLPKNTEYTDAAATVFGAHTALYFLKKAAMIPGQSILIYGASGAVGVAAIQLAKYYGAHVTAVTSTDNIQFVLSLGADKTIDYTKINLKTIDQRYDVVYEAVDKTSVSTVARLLKPGGTLILGAAIIKSALIGAVLSSIQKFRLIIGTAVATSKDMRLIKQLIESGDLKPVIDKTFDLEQIVEAHRYVDLGKKRGNVVIKIK